MFIVYQITNQENGKFYVGFSSKSLDERWRGHLESARGGSKYRLHKAIRRYGAGSFRKEILFTEETKQAALETEILLILDRNPEYNQTKGGECGPVYFGDENVMSRPDIREKHKASMSNGETGRKISAANTGKVRSETSIQKYINSWDDDRRRKQSTERSGDKNAMANPAHRAKQFENAPRGSKNGMFKVTGPDHPSYGKKHSEETLGKMRKPRSAQGCANIKEGIRRAKERKALDREKAI